MSEWLKRQNLILRAPDNLFYYQQYDRMLNSSGDKVFYDKEYYIFRIIKNYNDNGFKGLKKFLKRRKVFK